MSSFSRISLCGALTGLAVLIGATTGPANASITHNSLLSNALTTNSLTVNALTTNSLSPNGASSTGDMATTSAALDDLNGVAVEAVSLPPRASHQR